MKEKDPSPKEEALNALAQARKLAEDGLPLTGVRAVQFRSFLEYAEEQITQIQELKRPRKEKSA